MSEHHGHSAAHLQPGTHDGEEGRIMILIVALMTIALLVVAVGIVVTSVHLQQRALLSCADRISAASARVVSANSYYGADEAWRPAPSPQGAHREALRTLQRLSTTTCALGQGVEIVDFAGEEGVVRVTVRTTATLPLLPPALNKVSAPILMQTSSARTV